MMASWHDESKMDSQIPPQTITNLNPKEVETNRTDSHCEDEPIDKDSVKLVDKDNVLQGEVKSGARLEINETRLKQLNLSESVSSAAIGGDLVEQEDNLIDAIKQDRSDAVKKLLNEGNNPNEPVDNEGNRPLHWAVVYRKPEYVRWLLEAGVDVNLSGKENTIPLMVTPTIYHKSAKGDVPWDVIHNILKANCDLNRMTNKRKSTLHLAVQFGNVELVRILLHYKVNIDIRDSKGRSPIMYAAMLSCANILEYTSGYEIKDIEHIAYLLIKANANVIHVDKFRQNALHLAIPNFELCERNKVQQISLCIVQMLELAGSKIPAKRFFRRWSSVSKETSKHIMKVVQWFDSQRKAPKSLHHSCRLVIRRTMGQNINENIFGLTLPIKIKQYLLMPELEDLINSFNV